MRRAQAEPPNWYPVEQRDPRYSGVSGPCNGDGILQLIALSPKGAGTPFLNHGQDVGDRAETAMLVPGHAQVQVAPWPQTAVSAKIFSFMCGWLIFLT